MPKVGQVRLATTMPTGDVLKLKSFASWVRHVTVNLPSVDSREAHKIISETLVELSEIADRLEGRKKIPGKGFTAGGADVKVS